MSDAHICTFSGVKFDILEPTIEMVKIEDIAHALGHIVRFTGHCRKFYSVAEHSVLVSQVCNPQDALWGLLHDASEAYIGDVSRPVKHHTGGTFGDSYKTMEQRIMDVICRKFKIPTEEPESVKMADDRLLLTEQILLMPAIPWVQEYLVGGGVNPLDLCSLRLSDHPIKGWSPGTAKTLFLARFAELYESMLLR